MTEISLRTSLCINFYVSLLRHRQPPPASTGQSGQVRTHDCDIDRDMIVVKRKSINKKNLMLGEIQVTAEVNKRSQAFINHLTCVR